MSICDYCLLEHCPYIESSIECQSARIICDFCLNHRQGDVLYDYSSWEGGISFDYIENIKYCPLCGRTLKEI